MELTPELFEKIEFTERRKGYDTEQVETFLEDAGTALAQLLARVRHTEERAAHAEARLAEADARIAAAEERVGEAQAHAQAQVAQAQASVAAARSASAISEEAEVEQAAKTLLMARRTAEAMENEARGQAQALLGEAKTRADRQLGEAQAEAEELIRRARSQADSEFAERRGRALEEVQVLENRRAQLADVITGLEGRLAGYREDLTRTAEELTLLASDPDRLGARPTLSIPPDEVLSPQRAEPPLTAVSSTPEPAPLIEPEPIADVVVETPAEPEASASPVEVDLGDGGPPTEAVQVGDGPGSDTWGPGSWSRLESSPEGDLAEHVDADVRTVAPEVRAEPVVEETISLADEPSPRDPHTQQTPQIRAEPVAGAAGRDRYLKDLDDAVNESGEDDDEAMTAFFEGSSDTRNRRFGWRR
jgi:cell division septum initiation protein DivIVA